MMKKESRVKVAALSQNPSYVTLIKKFFFVNIMSSFLQILVLEFCQRNLYQGLLYLHPHQISHQCTFDASKTLAAFPNAKLDDCQRKFFNVIMGSLFFRDGIFLCCQRKCQLLTFLSISGGPFGGCSLPGLCGRCPDVPQRQNFQSTP